MNRCVLHSCVLLLVAGIVLAAAADPDPGVLALGTFAAGNDGFGGSLTQARDAAGGFGVLANTSQKWVETSKVLGRLEQDFAALTLEVRSADATRLAVRLVDATGQSFQQRLDVRPDGVWQTLRITTFGQGEIWGGAGDKTWHPPARQIALVLEQKATLHLRAIRAELKPGLLPAAAARRALLAKGPIQTIASFEDGRDGFSGALTVDRAVAHGGTAAGRIDNKDEKWVTATRALAGLGQDFLVFRFWVRSTDARQLAVRFVDATGQNHQQRVAIVPDGAWQQVTIESFNAGDTYQSWGGAADKAWHPPAASVAFILEKGAFAGKSGTVWLDGVEAVLNPEAVVPDLDVGLCRTGSVFAAGEAVTLPVVTRASEVAWEVTDFWHSPVATGHVAVADHRCTVRLPSNRNGYFLARLTARCDGKAAGEVFASYAVVPPYTVRDPAACPFGAMTHFAQGMDPAALLPLLKRLGIVSIRDEHYWGQVEKQPGVYAFPEKSDAYMAACASNSISPLIAMTFENKLHDGGLSPYTPAGCDAYGRYGEAILKQYGPQIRWLEIWNEYNGSWCKGPATNDRPRYYAQMLKAAYARIKAARPDVQVLGCACVLIPLPYIEGIFKNGGLDAMDGVVIHPYRGQPEGVEQEVDDLQALIRKYNQGQDKPVWVTETGHHEKTEADWETGKGLYERGRQDGARYLARMYVLLLTRHIQHIYWYLSCDHMSFVSMGLLRRATDPAGVYAVAPAYVTYATLIRQLDGASFVRREARRDYTRAHVYLFARDGEEIRTCWATQPAKLRVRARGPLTRVDVVGNATTLAPMAGGLVLDLGEDLFYLKGKVEQIEEVDTGVRILGDAQDDYTKTQGGNNWFYGYFDGTGKGLGDGIEPKGAYTDDDFKEMEQKETMWGVDWAGPVRYLTLSRGSMHPAAANGRNIDAVLRWKSPLAGTVRLAGDATRGEAAKGDGVLVRILINGEPRFEKVIGGGSPATTSFDLPVTVGVGTLVDLVVDPRGSTEYDATGYHLRILQDTKP